MIDLSIVIVSWNVRDLLQRCLHSIFADREDGGGTGGNTKLEVIVVDNASVDGSCEMVRQAFPSVRLIANASNKGFPAANNQGITMARGRYVLLLNPDTEIVGAALSKLVEFADQHPDIGVIGPQLLNPDGSIQSSRRRFPTLVTAFIESSWLQPTIEDLQSSSLMSPLAGPFSQALERYYVADQPEDVVQDVDWVTGAAMLVRWEAIDDVGIMDEGFFMYSEELDWCKRFREANWRVVYVPAAKIVHHVGQSSDQVVAARHIHFQTSKVRYFHKHHGPLVAAGLRWYLLTNYACQLTLEGIKWLVGHKRPLRAERARAYLRVLASGLRRRTQD